MRARAPRCRRPVERLSDQMTGGAHLRRPAQGLPPSGKRAVVRVDATWLPVRPCPIHLGHKASSHLVPA